MKLKKLKNVRSEHDADRKKKNGKGTYVMAASVIVAALLLTATAAGAVVRSYTHRQETLTAEGTSLGQDDSIINQQDGEQRLNSLQEYLSHLDQMIQENQGKLNEVIRYNEQNQLTVDTAVLEELQKQLETIGEVYDKVLLLTERYEPQLEQYKEGLVTEEAFSSFLENYVSVTELTHTGIVDLQTNLLETKKEITDSLVMITQALEEVNGNTAEINGGVAQRLQAVENAAGETTKQLQETKLLLQDAITKMKQSVEANIDTAVKQNHLAMVESMQQLYDRLYQVMEEEQNVMESSLTGLQKSVDSLTETALQLQDSLKEAVQPMHTCYQQLEVLTDSTAKQLEAFYGTYKEEMAASGLKMEQINTGIREMKELLTFTETKLEAALEALETKNEMQQEEITELLNGLSFSVQEVGNRLAQTEADVEKMVTQLADTTAAEHGEMLTGLEEIRTQITSEADEMVMQLKTQLRMLQEMTAQKFSVLQEEFDSGISELNTQLMSIHGQIGAVQSEITNLLQTMDEKDTEQYAALMEAIESSVGQIQEEVNAAHKELQLLIQGLHVDLGRMHVDVLDNHMETLKTLEGMEADMSASVEENMEKLRESVADLNGELSTQLEQMQQNQGTLDAAVGNLGGQLKEQLASALTSVLSAVTKHDAAVLQGENEIKDAIGSHVQKLTEHNTAMDLGHAALEKQIESHNTQTKTWLDAFTEEINQQLASVFTSVSSGKNLLASTLLTKGISINADATFLEIANAIRDIPQQIQLQQLPGKIVYEYHYHVDGAGNRPHTQESAVGGGCYTVAAKHTHTGSCYKTAVCGGAAEGKTDREHYWCNRQNTCQEHGCHWIDPNDMYPSGCWNCYCPEYTWYTCTLCGGINTGDPCTKTVTKLVCQKNESDTYSYSAGCGMLDGQIIAAHIAFTSAASASVYDLAATDTAEPDFTMEEGVAEPEHTKKAEVSAEADYAADTKPISEEGPASDEATAEEEASIEEAAAEEESTAKSEPSVEETAAVDPEMADDEKKSEETALISEPESVSETEAALEMEYEAAA